MFHQPAPQPIPVPVNDTSRRPLPRYPHPGQRPPATWKFTDWAAL